MPGRFRAKFYKILSHLIFWGIIFGFISATSVIFAFFYYAKSLPNPNAWAARNIVESTKIYDREGKGLLYEIHGEEKRTVIAFDQIPQLVKNATLAAEDAEFYKHSGINLRGILRAAVSDIKGQRLAEGGSSITQQLIKNAYLSPERTLSRKIREIILAIELEKKYSKNEILNFYLNQIPYGLNSYGIEAAALSYFNKPAKELNLAEAAYLSALPKAPSYYSPYGAHGDELKSRANHVLNRMLELKLISQAEYQKALETTVSFAPVQTNITAPHFVMFIREYLNDKYGEDVVEKGGLKVTTTIDSELQKLAEKVVKEGAERNAKLFQAENTALAAIDPRTGEILAMAGSKSYFATSTPEGCEPGKSCKFEPHVNVTTRLRQPGSAFKPFAYAAAFKKGYTPDTIVWDVPTEFNPLCEWDGKPGPDVTSDLCYRPGNYDGLFRGPVTMRQALSNSLNVPSVKVLYLAGISDTIDLAESFGISTLKDRSRFGLSLVLGGAEVKLLDMVSAYGVFSQEGIKREPVGILKVEDSSGRVLEEYRDQSQKVLDEQTARLINDILSDNNARAPMFGLYSPLSLGEIQAAVKTGTTQDPNDSTKARDAWTIGYTPSLVAGVWVGNNDNSPVEKGGAGLMAAAPLWHDFMIGALSNTPLENFTPPDPIITEKPVLNGQPQNNEILQFINKNEPQGQAPASPENDSQYKNWEAAFKNWLKIP